MLHPEHTGIVGLGNNCVSLLLLFSYHLGSEVPYFHIYKGPEKTRKELCYQVQLGDDLRFCVSRGSPHFRFATKGWTSTSRKRRRNFSSLCQPFKEFRFCFITLRRNSDSHTLVLCRAWTQESVLLGLSRRKWRGAEASPRPCGVNHCRDS